MVVVLSGFTWNRANNPQSVLNKVENVVVDRVANGIEDLITDMPDRYQFDLALEINAQEIGGEGKLNLGVDLMEKVNLLQGPMQAEGQLNAKGSVQMNDSVGLNDRTDMPMMDLGVDFKIKDQQMWVNVHKMMLNSGNPFMGSFSLDSQMTDKWYGGSMTDLYELMGLSAADMAVLTEAVSLQNQNPKEVYENIVNAMKKREGKLLPLRPSTEMSEENNRLSFGVATSLASWREAEITALNIAMEVVMAMGMMSEEEMKEEYMAEVARINEKTVGDYPQIVGDLTVGMYSDYLMMDLVIDGEAGLMYEQNGKQKMLKLTENDEAMLHLMVDGNVYEAMINTGFETMKLDGVWGNRKRSVRVMGEDGYYDENYNYVATGMTEQFVAELTRPSDRGDWAGWAMADGAKIMIKKLNIDSPLTYFVAEIGFEVDGMTRGEVVIRSEVKEVGRFTVRPPANPKSLEDLQADMEKMIENESPRKVFYGRHEKNGGRLPNARSDNDARSRRHERNANARRNY